MGLWYYARSLQQIGIFISAKSNIRCVVNEKYQFYKAEYRYVVPSVLKMAAVCGSSGFLGGKGEDVK